MTKPLSIALPSGHNFGWGLCGSYLRQELARRTTFQDLTAQAAQGLGKISGTAFVALEGDSLAPWVPLRADRTIGYVFFENELQEDSVHNSRNLDLILGGSTWCCERMREKGIAHTDVLIQGVDPELFYPIEEERKGEEFVLFSGGKFELRKGQDLVLKAFAILHRKYPDIKLVNIWENQWPESMRLMGLSPHIRFELQGSTWLEKMAYLYHLNGIDPSRVQTCPLVPNRKQRAILARTDLGVFPNRCEGGTNLVLMEYMACGKPVVAVNSTGHRDILTDSNSIRAMETRPFFVNAPDGRTIARWEEASLEELIAKIEWAYHHREALRPIARQAGEDLKRWTWGAMAERLCGFCE